MSDLINLLQCVDPHAEYFDQEQDASAELRQKLDSLGIKYTLKQNDKWDGGAQFDLKQCPFCTKTTSNPAAYSIGGSFVFKCFHADCTDRTFADLVAHYTPSKLPILTIDQMIEESKRTRKDILLGFIQAGDVVNLIGVPKARKSYWTLQLLLCIAAGRQFLAWPTVRSKVVLIDNELRRDVLGRRILQVCQALGIDWEELKPYFHVIPLRGQLADLLTLRSELDHLRDYDVVALDAWYKFIPVGKDENSNSDVAHLYGMLDELAERNECAIVVVHHASKGDQSQKRVSDLGSGAGAQSRSADCHVALREHEERDTVVLESVLRSQPPIDPICLEFRHPLWYVAKDKNPTKVAVSSKRPSPTLDQVLELMPVEFAARSEVVENCQSVFGISEKVVAKYLKVAVKKGMAEVIPHRGNKPAQIRKLKAA